MNQVCLSIVIILTILISILMIFMIGLEFYLQSKGKCFKKLYHDILKCHIVNEEEAETYILYPAVTECHCKICGKELKLNKEGDWV